MFTISSVVFLLASVIVIVLANNRPARVHPALGNRAHWRICAAVFALGCLARLVCLGSLPAGLSAEEALVAAQGKALWQTGGFLFGGRLTAQLAQWTGESSGPLLAALTAPFVGLLGISPWTARLPLALLSCAAMAAAYGLGDALAGRRGGRWSLTVYALCPYFVLSARMTCGASAAVCIVVIGMCLLARGMKRPALLYAGAAVTGLSAYTQDMHFFIAPVVVVLGAAVFAAYGGRKRHALGAALLGLLLCVPALLTLWVNLTGREGFVLCGVVEIPRLEAFDKGRYYLEGIQDIETFKEIVIGRFSDIAVGSVFQVLWHNNISMSLLSPNGYLALYFISVPLMLLGGFSMLHNRLRGLRPVGAFRPARTLVGLAGAAAFIALMAFGSEGLSNNNGSTCVFDYSCMFLFDAMLMVAGLCQLERRSAAGSAAMTGVLGTCFAALCLFMSVGSYRADANVYFEGFAAASQRAMALHEETGAKVNVTSSIYPHIEPMAAAEMMYLAGADADMTKAMQERGTAYEAIYPQGTEPSPQEIYLVKAEETAEWPYEAFAYEEVGGYVLLSPLSAE